VPRAQQPTWARIAQESKQGAQLILPDWATRFVVFLLVLGFPIALILARAHEMTPDGIERACDVSLGNSISSLTGRQLDCVLAVLPTLALGYIAADIYFSEGASQDDP